MTDIETLPMYQLKVRIIEPYFYWKLKDEVVRVIRIQSDSVLVDIGKCDYTILQEYHPSMIEIVPPALI